jgi:hypothetical protein
VGGWRVSSQRLLSTNNGAPPPDSLINLFWERERGVLALDFVDHHPSLFERDECCRALRLAAGGNIAAGAIAERRGIIAAAENTNNCHLSTLIYFHLNVQGPIKTGGKILLYGPCAPSQSHAVISAELFY